MNLPRRMLLLALSAGLLTSSPSVAAAQSGPRPNATQEQDEPVRERMLVPLMENSDLFLTHFSDTIFEARIAPHLVMKTFGDMLDYGKQEEAARDSTTSRSSRISAGGRRA